MTLDFRISKLSAEVQKKYRTEWNPILQRVAQAIGVPDDGIERVIISDEENYEAAINELCPGERFTNTNGLVGVGKSLPRLLASGRAVSDLVIRWEGVWALLEEMFQGKTPVTLDPDHLALAYVIPHEFGHCLDNFNRPRTVASTTELAGQFKIQNWARVQSEIATSEYAACVFSAGCVSEELLKHQFQSEAQSIGRLLGQIHEKRRAYRLSSELYALATDSCSTFWFAIIQAAKLFGQRVGNESLRAVPLHWDKWFPNSSAAEHLPPLEQALADSWQQYPAFDLNFSQECLRAWLAIAEAEGFRFVEGTEGDGLFFDKYSARDALQGLLPPNRF